MEIGGYKNGLNMLQFQHIPEISCYNHNYYRGFGSDLLHALSDDDNTTEWWLVKNRDFIHLGESYTSQDGILEIYDKRCT